MNLILIEPQEIAGSSLAVLSDRRAAHLVNVLHVAPGQSVRVGLVDGPVGTAIVTAINTGSVTLQCALEPNIPARPRVDLLLALPRPKVIRRLWAQLAALGVGQIMLTNAERVERNYFDTHVLEESSYRPLLIEGLQQAQDTRIPAVSIHRQFKVLVEDHLDGLFGEGLRLVAEPNATTAVGTALRGRNAQRVLIAIGPEGGWNEFELRLLEAHGFQRVGLGPRTLRVDTACCAMLAVVHAVIGEA
jgi:16S rRNA (uracil1498-N3)-methyltransferase